MLPLGGKSCRLQATSPSLEHASTPDNPFYSFPGLHARARQSAWPCADVIYIVEATLTGSLARREHIMALLQQTLRLQSSFRA